MLHIFGDSHTQIFSGSLVTSRKNNISNRYKNIKAHWLKEALTFNLIDNHGELGKWGKEIHLKLTQEENLTAVMLVFGEIDIRVHAFKRAILEDISPLKIIESVSDKLINFSHYLSVLINKPIIICCPIASSPDFSEYFNPEFPCTGSERDRNFLTFKFNQRVEEKISDIPNVYAVNIFGDLTDAMLNCNTEFYADSIHLNYKGLNLFIEGFRRMNKYNNLELIDYWDVNELKVENNLSEKNITNRCVIKKISSTYQENSELDDVLGRGYCFHTNDEINPYVLIDIGYVAVLSKLIIANREICANRLVGFYISTSISGDEDDYSNIPDPADCRLSEGTFLVKTVENLNIFTRYIKIGLNSKNYFHLKSVQIFEKSMFQF